MNEKSLVDAIAKATANSRAGNVIEKVVIEDKNNAKQIVREMNRRLG